MNNQTTGAVANTPSASTHTHAPTTSQIRRATPDDADALVQLVDIAGEGLASYLWDLSRAEGQSVWDYGRERALRESGAIINHIFVVFHYGIFESSAQSMAEMDVQLHALATWWDIIDLIENEKRLSSDDIENVKVFLNDPDEWRTQNDK